MNVTPREVLAHEDFERLVCYFHSKFGYSKFIEAEDFVQEVALLILKSNKVLNLSITTYIGRNCQLAMGRLSEKKRIRITSHEYRDVGEEVNPSHTLEILELRDKLLSMLSPV